MGEFHRKKSNISEASNFYHKALDAQMKSPSLNHRTMKQIYTYLADIYKTQKDYIKAIDCLQRAISIALTYNDNKLPFLYAMIASSYGYINDYERASQYNELGLDAARNILPSDHPCIQSAKKYQAILRLLLSKTHKTSIS
jgi:tetratricopeptide (TPR) repeat protein